MFRIKKIKIFYYLGNFLIYFSFYFPIVGDDNAFKKVLFCVIMGGVFIGIGGGYNKIKRKQEEKENKE
jgi:hypothetical protein